jgi:guanylate kinase
MTRRPKVWENILTVEEETAIIKWCDSQPFQDWQKAKGDRKVLQYGFQYNYYQRLLSLAPPIPKTLQEVVTRMKELKVIDWDPEQVIINAYDPGQRITAHIDAPGLFGSEIVTLSLGDETDMLFKRKGKIETKLHLIRRSALLLTGFWRSEVTHETLPLVEGRRLSITFRTVLPQAKPKTKTEGEENDLNKNKEKERNQETRPENKMKITSETQKLRIVLCGKAASGKDYLKARLCSFGLRPNIGVTTRPARSGEVEGETYHFISKDKFQELKEGGKLYEHDEFNGWNYGTLQSSWQNAQVFIMTPRGVEKIKTPEDRAQTLVVYLDISAAIRRERLATRDSPDPAARRMKADQETFEGFQNFDIRISNPEFSAEGIVKICRLMGFVESSSD